MGRRVHKEIVVIQLVRFDGGSKGWLASAIVSNECGGKAGYGITTSRDDFLAAIANAYRDALGKKPVGINPEFFR